MKIEQLLEIINPTVSSKRFGGQFSDRGDDVPETDDVLGQGYYSVVRKDKKDPHMVKKNTKWGLNKEWGDDPDVDYSEHDGYDPFVEKLIQYNLMDNPFFPRIYDIKKITDKRGRVVHTYQMEKLLSWDQISEEEMDMVIKRYLVTYDSAMLRNNLGTQVPEQKVKQLYFAGEIDEAIESSKFKNVKDETMLDAIGKLRQISQEIQAESEGKVGFPDFNSGNIMYRRTKNGIQPVFSDPLV